MFYGTLNCRVVSIVSPADDCNRIILVKGVKAVDKARGFYKLNMTKDHLMILVMIHAHKSSFEIVKELISFLIPGPVMQEINCDQHFQSNNQTNTDVVLKHTLHKMLRKLPWVVPACPCSTSCSIFILSLDWMSKLHHYKQRVFG